MSAIFKRIFDLLSDDILSYGLLVQSIEHFNRGSEGPQLNIDDILIELLRSGKVEIGIAKNTSPDYVEFIAWKGTIEERVSRAAISVIAADGPDREFAYWLCLHENIDRFEERGPT